MMRRGFLTGFLLILALAMGGAALWQTRAVDERDSIIAELRNFLTDADRAAGLAGLEKHALEVDLRHARAALKETGNPEALEVLRAELAAARQQLSAAETAMIETEDRLAEEIAAHATLKQKAEGLTEQLAAAWREIEAADAKAERAQAEIAKRNALSPATKVTPESTPSAATSSASPPQTPAADSVGATGSLSDDTSESGSQTPVQSGPPVTAAAPALQPTVKKARPRRAAKPAVKAVKPAGGLFDPML